MKLFCLLLLSLSSLLLSACSSTKEAKYVAGQPQVTIQAPPPMEYKKDGISFTMTADPQLNRYKNASHTLLVCLYQLRDPNAFNQLSEEPGSLGKLMECNKFDSSVTFAKRIVLQPGKKLTDQRWDRAEGTRYIAIAAGYYGTGTEKTTYLSPITTRSITSLEIELGATEISGVTVK